MALGQDHFEIDDLDRPRHGIQPRKGQQALDHVVQTLAAFDDEIEMQAVFLVVELVRLFGQDLGEADDRAHRTGQVMRDDIGEIAELVVGVDNRRRKQFTGTLHSFPPFHASPACEIRGSGACAWGKLAKLKKNFSIKAIASR